MNCPSCDRENIPGADLCENCGLDLAGLDVGDWGVDPRDPLLMTPLAELELKKPLVLELSATAGEAIRLMQERGEGCVFITGPRGQLEGVFTERDVATRVVAPGRDADQVRLEDVMTWRPVALLRTDPLAWALHRMGVDGYRHLPVLDEGRLIGFLSARTVLRALVAA